MRIRPDTPVLLMLAKACNIILLTLVWAVCCAPVVTIGAATNGTLYRYVANQCRAGRSRHTGILGAMRTNWKVATASWGIMLPRRVIASWQHGCTFRGSGTTCSFDTDEGRCWACPD